MRVQDLLGEGELARGAQDAADFAETAEQLLVRRSPRGKVDVAGTRHGGGGSEASCLDGKAGGEQVRLLKSVFNTTSLPIFNSGAEFLSTRSEVCQSNQLHGICTYSAVGNLPGSQCLRPHLVVFVCGVGTVPESEAHWKQKCPSTWLDVRHSRARTGIARSGESLSISRPTTHGLEVSERHVCRLREHHFVPRHVFLVLFATATENESSLW